MHHDTADNGMELLLTYPVAKWSYQVELDWSPVTQTDISLAWFFTSLTVKPRYVGFLLKNWWHFLYISFALYVQNQELFDARVQMLGLSM